MLWTKIFYFENYIGLPQDIDIIIVINSGTVNYSGGQFILFRPSLA
jgi:hypothetical protein